MNILKDFKHAYRLLAKKPGFTVLTTLVMATGIGLSIYLFTFLHIVAGKPLPFKDSESLVLLFSYKKGIVDYGDSINLHDYHEIRQSVEGLSEFSAYRNISVNLVEQDGARRYVATMAEWNIFDITRTAPILGRSFVPDDDKVGAGNVVVIGYELWKNHFLSSPKVLGKSINVNGASYQVIGVMPEAYVFPFNADLWLPLRENTNRLDRGNSADIVGLAHIEPGYTMGSINKQLELVMQRLEQRYPKSNTGLSAYVTTMQNSQGTRDSYNFLYIMYSVSVLILILASINVGNLLLSRAEERGKETAIRAALGAPRIRLISQMLWESIIICAVGGIIGFLVMTWGLGVTQNVVSGFWFDKPPFWWEFGIDGFTVKLFLTFIVITIIVTGLIPAWKNSGGNFNALLRDGTRGALARKSGRLNRFLVVSEIFISIVVLITSGILQISSYLQLKTDYGSEIDNTLIARVSLPEIKYPTPESHAQLVATLQSHLESETGIGHAVISSALPGTFAPTPALEIEGREYTQDQGYPRANAISIPPGSLAKLGVELKQGRYFDNRDDAVGQQSIIVTESFAAQHFPGESPLGKRIQWVDQKLEWLSIIGVVEHTVIGDPNSDAAKIPSVYRPFAQAPQRALMIAIKIKSNRNATTTEKTLRKVLAFIDPELPAYRVEMYQDYIDRRVAPSLFISTIFLLFGVAAVILSASGIYAIMSNTINQRTQEIGIKRALGAWEQLMIKEFVLGGIKQFLWGGIPGLIAGCALGFVSLRIFGVQPSALLVIAVAITAIIGLVVMLATYLPTKRILQMEPSRALHYE